MSIYDGLRGNMWSARQSKDDRRLQEIATEALVEIVGHLEGLAAKMDLIAAKLDTIQAKQDTTNIKLEEYHDC